MVEELVKYLVSRNFELNHETLDMVMRMSQEDVIEATDKASRLLEDLKKTSMGKALL